MQGTSRRSSICSRIMSSTVCAGSASALDCSASRVARAYTPIAHALYDLRQHPERPSTPENNSSPPLRFHPTTTSSAYSCTFSPIWPTAAVDLCPPTWHWSSPVYMNALCTYFSSYQKQYSVQTLVTAISLRSKLSLKLRIISHAPYCRSTCSG